MATTPAQWSSTPPREVSQAAGELIGELADVPSRKEVALLPLVDIETLALDEVMREALAQAGSLVALDLGEVLERGIE